MRSLRAVVVVALIAGLSACTAVKIGERYDPYIEAGLNDYYKSTVAFVKQAQLNATKAAGRYGSSESNAFYASSAATLADLKLRAKIVGGNRSCPSIKIAAAVTSAAGVELNKAEQAVGGAADGTGAAVDQQPINVGANCTTVVINNVELAQSDLEADHKERGTITPTIADLNLQAIEASVRVALQTVQSHK